MTEIIILIEMVLLGGIKYRTRKKKIQVGSKGKKDMRKEGDKEEGERGEGGEGKTTKMTKRKKRKS